MQQATTDSTPATGAPASTTAQTTSTQPAPAQRSIVSYGHEFMRLNPVPDLVFAGAVACSILLAFYLLRPLAFRAVRRMAKKTKTRLDDMAAELIKQVRWWWVFVVAVCVGLVLVIIPPALDSGHLPRLARFTLVIATAVQLLLCTRVLVNYLLDYTLRANRQPDGSPDPAIQNSIGILRFLVMVALGVAIVLVALENLGVKVTPLLTGLGIGGIAVALAVQNILGDLFASLTIVLDKPFQVGDAITVGDKSGVVERIGIKTTRLRATSGEELVFGNSDLLSSRVQNFKRMQERRIAFTLGVVYELPPEQLRRIPAMVKEAVESAAKVRFDRCHFKSFGAYSLDFECVYFVTTGDYLAYMDAQQAINLAVFTRFEREGIEFAYPTQAQVQRKA